MINTRIIKCYLWRRYTATPKRTKPKASLVSLSRETNVCMFIRSEVFPFGFLFLLIWDNMRAKKRIVQKHFVLSLLQEQTYKHL